MINILKLSLVISGFHVLCALLSGIQYQKIFGSPHPFYPQEDGISLGDCYLFSDIVCSILSIVFFFLLLRKAAANSPLKWPFITIIGGFALGLLGWMMSEMLIKESDFYYGVTDTVKMLQLIKFIGAILLSAGLIWFGSFFEKRSLVRITSYILPVFIVLSAIISIYFMVSFGFLAPNHILFILLIIVHIAYVIFFYSFYKYNQSYGRN